ncbi:MAG: glycosyltransferase family 2 protein [Gimesia sp.]
MIDKNPIVSVVIVTFNASTWINCCIESVLNQSVSTIQIIVIDNNSQDDTVEKLDRYGKKITVIHSPGNIGFGRANNIGINKSIEMGCDYCFLLNQDAWIEPGCIASLVDAAEDNQDAGILSPVQCSYDSNNLHCGFQSYLPSQQRQLLPEFPFEVNFIQAALWLIPVNTLREVGGFDPVFFMYGEDDDLAARVRNSGRSIVVVPKAIGHHRESQGSPSIKRQAARYFMDTTGLLRFSYHPIWRRYVIAGVGSLRTFTTFACALKFRKCISLLLSLWWIARRSVRIETSRKTLLASRSPFLEIK